MNEALTNYQQALDIATKNLPSTHRDFTVIYNNISQIYCWQDFYQQAIEMNKNSLQIKLYKRALDIELKQFSSVHSSVTDHHMRIGCRHEGNKEDVLNMHQKSLNARITSVPPNHKDIGVSYTNLSMVFFI